MIGAGIPEVVSFSHCVHPANVFTQSGVPVTPMPSDFRESDTPQTPPETPSPGTKDFSDRGISAMRGATDTGDNAPDAPEAQENVTIGDPVADARYHHFQKHPDTCAVVAQQGIIEKHTGQKLSEEALRQEAFQNGWYGPGGTSGTDVGKIMEAHGVPVESSGSGDMDSLQGALEENKDVIAGVQAREWYRDPRVRPEVGHAVWVTGMELDQKGQPLNVSVNDSGEANGAGKTVSASHFKRAWAPTGNLMVVTENAARDGE